MMAFGYARNLKRHAEAWGPHLIAELLKCGILEAEEDPLEALQELISMARCHECRRVRCTCTEEHDARGTAQGSDGSAPED